MEQAAIKIPLRVERLSAEEALEYRHNSQVGITLMLKDLLRHHAPVALFYNDDQDCIVTHILEIDDDEEGMWLSLGDEPEANRQILHSGNIVFVSQHQQSKIQFDVPEIGIYPYRDGEAFFVDMPESILRILHREHVRISIPSDTSVTCLIPVRTGTRMNTQEVTVDEISGDGIGLVCEKDDEALVPDAVFKNCEIVIPEFGTIKASLRVRTNKVLTGEDGIDRKHAGCQLVFLDNRMRVLLERYIIFLQGIREREPLVLRPQSAEAAAETEGTGTAEATGKSGDASVTKPQSGD